MEGETTHSISIAALSIDEQGHFTCPMWHCTGWTLERCIKRQKKIRGRQIDGKGATELAWDYLCRECPIAPAAAKIYGVNLPPMHTKVYGAYVPGIAIGD